MNAFVNVMNDEERKVLTENGCEAYNTTTDRCLDLYSVIGALRTHGTLDTNRAERLFADAYKEDPLTAVKIVFYARDIRGGLGERAVVRDLFKYMAKYHPEAIEENIKYIGEYGRYDDLYEFIDTPLEDKMWSVMKEQLQKDLKALVSNPNEVSLLAKWIKTADASSPRTRSLGIKTAQKLGYPVYNFKRMIRSLRKVINSPERLMSANEWDKIDYSACPSRAMMIYRNAFGRHDEDRFKEFTNKALTGEAKINSSTLYPYDIVEKFAPGYSSYYHPNIDNVDILEAQWRQLPNYVEPGQNILVMADVSGSMSGRPMNSAIGLAMYFAERNIGDFQNLFMTFSSRPTIVRIKGETLEQKINFIEHAEWGGSTNLEAAFDLILRMGIANHIPQDQMPKALVIITDMEFDCVSSNTSGWHGLYSKDSYGFYDIMKERFAQYHYEIPNVVFWNVDSRHDTYHANANCSGIQLVSGQAASTFKNVIKAIGMSPYEAMREVIDSERYAPITIKTI